MIAHDIIPLAKSCYRLKALLKCIEPIKKCMEGKREALSPKEIHIILYVGCNTICWVGYIQIQWYVVHH